jgi:hypothetical protein
MGIYSLWPVFTALNLGVPYSAEAQATHTCTIEDHVSRTAKNDFSYPTACSIRLKFAAQNAAPPLDLFWYDGGVKPRLPDVVEAHDVDMAREGILFVGEEGVILAGFHGQNPQLFSRGKQQPLEGDSAKSSFEISGRRHDPWVRAILGGADSPGSFLNAGSITDAVNLGTVALRAGRRVLFDSEQMRITNSEDANRYLTRTYRPGWELISEAELPSEHVRPPA